MSVSVETFTTGLVLVPLIVWQAFHRHPEYSVEIAAMLSGCAVLSLLYFLKTRKLRQTSQNGVPIVDGGVPILGHGLAFNNSPDGFLLECRRRYGSAFTLNLAGSITVVLDGIHGQDFFKAPDRVLSFKEAALRFLVPEFTVGRDSITNDFHTGLVRREFNENNVGDFAQHFEEYLQHCFQEDLGLKHKGEIKQVGDLERLAWRSIAYCSARSFMGPELCTDPEVLDVFIHFNKHCGLLINLNNVTPRWALRFLAASCAKDTATIAKIIIPEIQRRKLEEQPERAGSTGVRSDLLSSLMACKDRDGHAYSPEYLGKRMMTLIFSSMVTTAGALTQVLYDIAGRREYWDRLYQEQATALAQTGGKLTKATLETVPFLTAFIRESMRMGSLPVQQARYCLQDTEVAGYHVPAGTTVVISGVLTAFNETFFKDPSTFNPGRFLDDTGQSFVFLQHHLLTICQTPENIPLLPNAQGKHHQCEGMNVRSRVSHIYDAQRKVL
ncbi:hypothetical protein CYMTET_22768 [Cymbomonas tetramitiformis]|uniref:Cytochrome P450 n=1 Tax=Cymbomonas tetramitiformis TaxID=36881 RepID=A0AAE0L1L5_9CHLO|nr:hypothetical protein CYMTET_22768 [Cymbomonas tetramitiformis]